MTKVATSSTSEASEWTKPRASLDGIGAIDHLYNRLDGMYPIRWRSNFPSPDAIKAWKDTWVEAFAEECISPQEVKTGLTNCRDMFEWPPSLTEFMRACRPWRDPEVAFYAAVRGMQARRDGKAGEWPHPAVFWAATSVGGDLLSSAYSHLRGRWEAALTAQLTRGDWEPIPASSAALPAPGQTVATREEAEAHLRKVGAASVVNNRRRDLREWPKRILAKPGNYSPAVIAMAKCALGIESEAS